MRERCPCTPTLVEGVIVPLPELLSYAGVSPRLRQTCHQGSSYCQSPSTVEGPGNCSEDIRCVLLGLRGGTTPAEPVHTLGSRLSASPTGPTPWSGFLGGLRGN